MTGRVAAPVVRTRRPAPRAQLLLALGLALGVAVCCPPLATLARRSEVADAAQFGVLALAVPSLVALGAPWWLGLDAVARWIARHRRGAAAGVGALVAEVGVVVAWRTTSAVGAAQASPALVVLEAASLLIAGVALWTALVTSPPLEPCVPPRRLVLSAVAMWAVWIVAYVLGMAHGQGYSGFAHTPGGLSGAADRQAATAVLFAAAAAAYLPIVFTSLFAWLAAEERRGAADTRRRLATPATTGVRREDVRPAG